MDKRDFSRRAYCGLCHYYHDTLTCPNNLDSEGEENIQQKSHAHHLITLSSKLTTQRSKFGAPDSLQHSTNLTIPQEIATRECRGTGTPRKENQARPGPRRDIKYRPEEDVESVVASWNKTYWRGP